jgi:hypothetical protein
MQVPVTVLLSTMSDLIRKGRRLEQLVLEK